LGVVAAEPIAEARKWRLRETAEPAQPREAPREKPAEKRPASAFGAGLLAEEARLREETSAAEAEQSAAAAAPWLEEIESGGEPKERRRRRKRRRSRGDRGGKPEDRATEAGEETTGTRLEGELDVDRLRPEEVEPEDSTRTAAERDELAPKGEEGGAEERPTGEERAEGEDRPRRGRRRRGRRGGDRHPRDEAAAPRGERRERPEEDVADTVARATDEALRPLDDEEEDAEDQEARAEDHRNIPAWQEAIGVIIDKNMESRAKNPHPYRSRGRGRGRG
jgi:hypothetical protein